MTCHSCAWSVTLKVCMNAQMMFHHSFVFDALLSSFQLHSRAPRLHESPLEVVHLLDNNTHHDVQLSVEMTEGWHMDVHQHTSSR